MRFLEANHNGGPTPESIQNDNAPGSTAANVKFNANGDLASNPPSTSVGAPLVASDKLGIFTTQIHW